MFILRTRSTCICIQDLNVHTYKSTSELHCMYARVNCAYYMYIQYKRTSEVHAC